MASSEKIPSRSRSRRNPSPGTQPADTAGGDLERRVARVEFAEGALVRMRVPVAAPGAESGRDILTDIDILSVDVDLRLRTTRSSSECKSGRGQSGEPSTLVWLAGFRQLLRLSRVTFVRPAVSSRGRLLAKRLGVLVLDEKSLATREEAIKWVPERFGRVDGKESVAAETRTDVQLRGLPDISASVAQFLRYESMLADSPALLAGVEALGRGVRAQGGVPEPTNMVLASHALVSIVFAAVQDASRLAELSPRELRARLERALATGDPDDEHLLPMLDRADALFRYTVERIHRSYTDAGAEPLRADVPSLREAVATPPDYLNDYLDLVDRIRSNPSVARDLLQTADLACFDYLLGGSAWEAPSFGHLFSPEHKGLLLVALRCLGRVAGVEVADALSRLRDLPTVSSAVPDRRGSSGSADGKIAPSAHAIGAAEARSRDKSVDQQPLPGMEISS